MTFVIAFFGWTLLCVILPGLYLKSLLGQSYSVEIAPAQSPNETPIHRSILSPKALITTPHPLVKTLYELLKHGAAQYPTRPLFGSRSLIKVVEESKEITKVVGGETKKETKTWKFFELGSYEWLSYAQVVQKTAAIGAGLRQLGLVPKDKVTLFASTSRDWMTMAHGCFTQNLTITTAYDTLGEDGLSFSVNEGQVSTLFTQSDLLPMVKRILPLCSTLKRVIYAPSLAGLSDQDTLDLVADIKNAYPEIQMLSFQELVKLGEAHPCEPTPPTAEDLCCVMYTSGSTGNPKGVMLSHGNIVAAVAGATKLITIEAIGDTMLSYLPLAHILEFLVESYCIFMGVKIGYGSVRTLTDASVRNCKGDIGELKPTSMAGVPAVWETIRKGVITKLNQATPAQKRVFDLAFSLKWACIQFGLPSWTFSLLDKIVFNKIKAQTGGRLQLLVSGGAPIPKETQQFLTVCIGPMIQGYGMTETVGTLSGQFPSDQGSLGTVGPPFPNCEVKLVSVPDSNYRATNNQGEVLVRGPNIMKGYYARPDLTSEIMDGEWLRTGDIGQWQSNGTLSIIDRKKNLVKLANGEYIALEKLEAQYKTCLYVQNLCVIADPFQNFPVAIVVPVEKALASFLGKPGATLEELANDDGAIKALSAELKKVGQAAGLKGAELLGDVRLVADEWTSMNGCLTAAQKIKRSEIMTKYASHIEAMYKSR